MKRLTRLVLLALMFQLFLGSFVVSAAGNSSNITASNEATVNDDISGHWAEATIKSWLEQGYINGYSDGSFRPNNGITRAEFVKIVNHVFEVNRMTADLHYHDLPRSHWAYDEFAAAIKAGYIGGTSQNTLSPDKIITRQEAAVILVKLKGIGGSTSLQFKDADDIPSWSRNAIEALVAGGYINGDAKGNFRPKDGLTRAEAIVLIDKVRRDVNLPKEMLEEEMKIEQLHELPNLLSGINSSPSIIWTKKLAENTKAPVEGFDSNYFSYMTVLDQSLMGENITISFQANPILDLSIHVVEKDIQTNTIKESVLFTYGDPREDVHLRLEDKKDYTIYVNIINPYSGAYQDYRFELLSPRDEGEWFKLSQLTLSSQLLQVGDQVEVKMPGDVNTTGKTYTYKFTVVSDDSDAKGSYAGDTSFSLVNYYDTERDERISFTPSNGKGNISIKLIRNSAVLHERSYEYDFSPLNQLYGVIVHQFNAAERAAYIKKNNEQADIVYEVDFSSIAEAAYVSVHSEIPFTTLHDAELKKAIPSVQDIGNTTTYYKLDEQKKLIRASYLHFPKIDKDIQTKFIVFDHNKKTLGYVVIIRELNEEYVSNRITLIKDNDDFMKFLEGQKVQ